MSEGRHDPANTAVQPINEGRPEATEHNLDALHAQDLNQDVPQPALKKEVDEKSAIDGHHGHSDMGGDASTDVLSAPAQLHKVKENLPEVIRNIDEAADRRAAPSLAEPKQSNASNGPHAHAPAAVQQGALSVGSDVLPIAEDSKLATLSGAERLDTTASALEAHPMIAENLTRVTPEAHTHVSNAVEPSIISHPATEESCSHYLEHFAQPSLYAGTAITEAAASDAVHNRAESLSDIRLATPLGVPDTVTHAPAEGLDAPAVVPTSSDKAHTGVPMEITESADPEQEQTEDSLSAEAVTASLETVQEHSQGPALLEQSQGSAHGNVVHVDVTKEAIPVLETAKEPEVVKKDRSVAPQENVVELKTKEEIIAPGTGTASVIHDEHLVKDVIPAPEPEIRSTNVETSALAPETTAPATELVEPEMASTMVPQPEVRAPAAETSIEARFTTPETCLVSEVPTTAAETAVVEPGMLEQTSEQLVNTVETSIPAKTPIVDDVTTIVEAPVASEGPQALEQVAAVETAVVLPDQISEPSDNAAGTAILVETMAEPVTAMVEVPIVTEQVAEEVAEVPTTAAEIDTIESGISEAPIETMIPVETQVVEPMEIQQAVEKVAAAPTTAVETNVVKSLLDRISEPHMTLIAESVTIETPAVTEFEQTMEGAITTEGETDEVESPLDEISETPIETIPPVEAQIVKPVTAVVEAPAATEIQQAMEEEVAEVPTAAVVQSGLPDQNSEPPVDVAETTIPTEIPIFEVTTAVEVPVTIDIQQVAEETVVTQIVPAVAVPSAPEIITTTPEIGITVPVIEAPLIETNIVEIEAPIADLLAKAEVELERPKSPWTPSYSVTTQGPDIQDQDEIAELELSAPTNEEAHFVETETTKTVEIDSHVTAGKEDVEDRSTHINDIESDVREGIPSSASLTLPRTELERPKSPWTPSYSVMVQGSAEEVLPAENDVAELKQVPRPHEVGDRLHTTQEVDVVIPAPEEIETQQSADGAESTNALQIDTSAVHSEDNPKEPELVPNTDLLATVEVELERPKSPWTPSYSVMNQGSVAMEPLSNEGIAVEQLSPSTAVDPDVVGNNHDAGFQSTQTSTTNQFAEVEPLSPPEEDDRAIVQEVDVIPTSGVVPAQVRALRQCLDLADIASAIQVDTSALHLEDSAKEPELVPPTDLLATAEVELERPKSPWTPSYSVINQGSVATEPLSDEGIAEVEQLSPSAAVEPEVAANNRDTSATNQIAEVEPPPLEEYDDKATTQEVDVIPPSGAVQGQDSDESASVIQVDTSIVHSGDNAKEPELVPQTDLLATAEVELERPKSPWTPSYSVMTQGSVATESLSDEGIAEVDQPSPSAAVEPEVVDDKVTTQEVDVIPASGAVQGQDSDESASAIQVDTSTVHSEDNAKEPELVPQTDSLVATEVELERPKSPWTPSYSVTRQGSVASDQLPEEQITDLEQPVTDEPRMVDNGDDSEFQPVKIETTNQPVNDSDETVKLEQLSPDEGVVDPAQTVPTQQVDVVVATLGAEQPQNSDQNDISNVIQIDPSAVQSEGNTNEPELDPHTDLLATTDDSVMNQGSISMESFPEETTTAVRQLLPATDEPEVVDNNHDAGFQAIQTRTTELPVQDEITQLEGHPPVSEAKEIDDRLHVGIAMQKVDIVVPTPEVPDDNFNIANQIHSALHSAEIAKEPALVLQTDTDLLTTTEVELERPKSPWTPSYTVTRQGSLPSELAPEEESSDLGRVSPLTTDEPQIVDHRHDPEFQQTQTNDFDSGLRQGDIQDSEKTDLLTPMEAEVERPKSPWTPSYSVMRQGSVSADVPTEGDIVEVELPPPVINVFEATEGIRVDSLHGDHLQSQIELPSEVSSTAEKGLHEDAAEVDEHSGDTHPVELSSHREENVKDADLHTLEQCPSPLTNGHEILDDSLPTEVIRADVQVQDKASTAGLHLYEYEAELITEPHPTTLTALEKAKDAPPAGSLTPPDIEAERPASPWTPSYSVMTLGPEIADKVADAESSPAPNEPEVVDDNQPVPRLPQYDSLLPEKITEPLGFEVDFPAANEPGSIGSVLHNEVPVVDDAEKPSPHKEDSLPLIIDPSLDAPAEERRPKSPWTPSYSVTTVGNTLPDTSEADGSEQLSQARQKVVAKHSTGEGEPPAISCIQDAAGADVSKDFVTEPTAREPKLVEVQVTDHDEKPLTTSVKSIEEPSIISEDDSHVAEVEVSPRSISQEDPDRPKSPWIASHSVTRQGSGFFDTGASDGEELDRLEQLSNPPLDQAISTPDEILEGNDIEIFDRETPKSAKILSRLAPVNEYARSGDASTILNVSPTTTTRTRHESTTSSRFFPGGWFVPKPEGRTSLDTAKGMIVSPVTPVVPAAPPPSAVDREVQEENERKSRWCIVM